MEKQITGENEIILTKASKGKKYSRFFNKNNFNIFCLIVLLGCIIFGAITYSSKSNFASQVLTSEILMIDEDAYGDTILDTDNVNLVPILDTDIYSKDDNVIKIEFYVGGSDSNTIDNITYDIALSDLEIDCNLLSSYVKWLLIKNNVEISSGSLDYNFDTIVDGRLVLTGIQQDLVDYSEDKSVYDHYVFYLWLSDSCQSETLTECLDASDQSYLLNKSIKGKIEVELYKAKKETLIRNPGDVLNTETCIEGDSE